MLTPVTLNLSLEEPLGKRRQVVPELLLTAPQVVDTGVSDTHRVSVRVIGRDNHDVRERAVRVTVVVRPASAFLRVNNSGYPLTERVLHGFTDLIDRRRVNRRVSVVSQPLVHAVLETTVMEARVPVSDGVHVIAACERVNAQRNALRGAVSADSVKNHPPARRATEIVVRLPGPRNVGYHPSKAQKSGTPSDRARTRGYRIHRAIRL